MSSCEDLFVILPLVGQVGVQADGADGAAGGVVTALLSFHALHKDLG